MLFKVRPLHSNPPLPRCRNHLDVFSIHSAWKPIQRFSESSKDWQLCEMQTDFSPRSKHQEYVCSLLIISLVTTCHPTLPMIHTQKQQTYLPSESFKTEISIAKLEIAVQAKRFILQPALKLPRNAHVPLNQNVPREKYQTGSQGAVHGTLGLPVRFILESWNAKHDHL